ncbi:MAG TPA: TrmJ/YjtD family RNA methyltransferase [Terriglobales bacterium]|nr:TrmJ/YjtD family RNA methyltransferase [Terriglobales bacterium]
MLRNDLLRVVLVGTRNPLNIGAVARAMSNFGFEHLRVVNPYQIAFREARSAVGAAEVLAHAEEYTSVQDAVADCALVVGTGTMNHRELKHSVIGLEQGAEEIRKASCRAALLFGSEKRGLSNHDLSYCQWLLRIPTREAQPSMNLAQAVAVCLYELSRHPQSAKLEPSSVEPAAAQDLDRLTAVLTQALCASGYASDQARTPTEEKVRRLIRRLHLSADDASLLLGMLRHMDRVKR